MKPDKAARKAMLKEWAAGERQKARDTFPLASDQLGTFFSSVDEAVEQAGCFHDTRHANAAIATLGLTMEDAERLLAWCREHGGYCDCEIAANAQEYWEENRIRG